MKTRLNPFFPLLFILGLNYFLVSCEKYDDSDIQTRLTNLENSSIASINQQVSRILSSISALEGVDAELRKTISELKAKDGNYETEIAKLKELDNSLEKRITELKNYVDGGLTDNKTSISSLENLLVELGNSISEIQAKNGDFETEITKIKENVNAFEKRIDDLRYYVEGVNSNNTSLISTLDSLITELKKSISEIQAQNGNFEKEIANLKEIDTSLENNLVELKNYVDGKLSENKNWIIVTFSTLEQYNSTCDELAKIKENISKLKVDISTEIDNSITLSETSIKKWVNEQLTGYWNIAETQAKLDELKNAETEDIKKINESIATAKEEMSVAYIKAIKEAIEQSDGKLSKQIEEVNKALEKKIGTIEDRLAAIEEKLNNLLRDFNIVFDDNEIGILAGGTTTIGYSIVGATEKTTIKVFGQNGWSAKVAPSGYDKGIITIYAPTPITEDEIIVLVYDGEYRTVMSSIKFVEGNVKTDSSTKELEQDAGSITIAVNANMNYNVSIPDDVDWLTYSGTGSLRPNSLTFSFKKNEGGVRKAVVSFVDKSNKVINTLVFIQNGSATKIEMKEAGTLTNIIEKDIHDKIKGLIITGPINGTDILYIRRMSNLIYLDLSEARIVSGGNAYNGNNYTQDDVVGNEMFRNLSIKTIILPKGTTRIGRDAFSQSELGHIEIPSTVTVIDQNAFTNCYSLFSVVIPEGVKRIENSAFYNMALKEVSLPLSLEYIGGMAFHMDALESLTLPPNITYIGDQAFRYIPIKELHLKMMPSTITYWGSYCFSSYETTKVYIPKGTYDKYVLTEIGNFKHIEEE